MLLPIILGIGAKVAGTAITAWQAAAIGAGVGAVGTNLMKNNQNQQQDDVIPDDGDDLEELEEMLRRRRLRRMKRRN